MPLHSMVAPAEQRRVFLRPPPGVRKIVLATNIGAGGARWLGGWGVRTGAAAGEGPVGSCLLRQPLGCVQPPAQQQLPA